MIVALVAQLATIIHYSILSLPFAKKSPEYTGVPQADTNRENQPLVEGQDASDDDEDQAPSAEVSSANSVNNDQ